MTYPSRAAGQDATEAFYGLHRHEVIEKPQFKRLQIGVIQDEKSVIHGSVTGELSQVPYAEPLGLTPGYHSPYYTEASIRCKAVLCSVLTFRVYSEPPEVPDRCSQICR